MFSQLMILYQKKMTDSIIIYYFYRITFSVNPQGMLTQMEK